MCDFLGFGREVGMGDGIWERRDGGSYEWVLDGEDGQSEVFVCRGMLICEAAIGRSVS